MSHRTQESRIHRFLAGAGWVDADSVVFLASGEYNENYTVRSTDGGTYVFRINHGSQLGLDRQIEYEFRVLETVHPSGVTPRPYFYESNPSGIDGGVLLMEYIPGAPFDYRADRDKAAGVFARVHRLPIGPGLIVQADPVLDIAGESLGLLNRYPEHPLAEVKLKLLKYHENILALGQSTKDYFKKEPMCIVNTEVNSGNFIVRGDGAFLVDWEKAVVSYRYQDLRHFLVPTTTLWKTDYLYSEEEKLAFLSAYREELSLAIPPDELREKTRILERTITLRGLSWCFMAYYEYTLTSRKLRNESTFSRIRHYLDNADYLIGLAGS